MFNNLIDELNKQQKEAANYFNGPSIILAGAGSGKTRVLIAKVVNLINNHQIAPSSILMITFTNKAADEMKKRIGFKYRLGYVGTFHSLSAKILREDGKAINLHKNFIIYDEDDQLSLIKQVIKLINLGSDLSPAYFLNRISSAKNKLISPEKYLQSYSDYNAYNVYCLYDYYQKELKKNNAVDFDDLLNLNVSLFEENHKILEKYQNKYRYLLIDEFQDTNYVQYYLIKLLSQKYKNLTVVGDFSQSIYSWRGAEIENLRRLEKDFPQIKTFYLEKNYRSTQPILNFAHQIISKNQTHPILHLYTDKTEGDAVVFNELENEEEEAIFITNTIKDLQLTYPLEEIAVLYRINAQSRIIEEVLLYYGIPYLLIGGIRFYERKEIKDILSYLRLLINPLDRVSFNRIIKLGKNRWKKFQEYFEKNKDVILKKESEKLIEEIIEKTQYLNLYNLDKEEGISRLENIKELKSVAKNFPNLTQFLEQISLVESEYFEGEKNKDKKNKIRLMTLHQSKGLEFSVVFIIGVEEGILPHSRALNSLYQLEEERRLFYVGITRAKQKLYITYTKKRFIFGSINYSLKSRFIDE